MLKKFLIVLAFTSSILLCAEEVALLNQNFSQGLKYWAGNPANVPGFSITNDKGTKCIAATGVADKKKQSYLCLQQLIKVKEKEILGKQVIFGADFKPEKISGSLKLMIREIDSKGKTVRYRKITLDKWSKTKWQKRSAAFVVDPPTKSLAIYILSSYLQPKDKILIKNIFVKINEYKK